MSLFLPEYPNILIFNSGTSSRHSLMVELGVELGAHLALQKRM